MRRDGFSMVELLVVVCITASTASILIPALNASRDQAKSLKCASQIKDMVCSLNVYDAEHGSYPCGLYCVPFSPVPRGGYVGNRCYDRLGIWWFQAINDSKFKWCPSREVTYIIRGNVLCANYGINASICKNNRGPERNNFVGVPLGLKNIKSPSRTMLLMDSGYTVVSWKHATDNPAFVFEQIGEDMAYVPGLVTSSAKPVRRGTEKDSKNGRHYRKTVNTGYPDGHIEKIKASETMVKFSDGQYWNRSPFWEP